MTVVMFSHVSVTTKARETRTITTTTTKYPPQNPGAVSLNRTLVSIRTGCPSFSWDGAKFLHSRKYETVFWIGARNHKT